MRILLGDAQTGSKEIVLFPFDDYAIPFQHGVRLELNSYKKSVDKKSNIVVGLGESGAPDDTAATAYGTVRRVGEELWLWYFGQSGAESDWHQRLCLATSRDGKVWERPNLGLVEFAGNKNNNIVSLPIEEHAQAAVVFYEPDDPDPRRRFKMSFESREYGNQMAVAFSEDGLSWNLHPVNPVGPRFEQAGGTRYNGIYYLTGQGWSHWSPKGWARKLETHISYDFDSWSPASCVGLDRDRVLPALSEFGANSGPQVHLGAALWNRGNTLIGFYGKWNGHPTNDRRLTWMDLGMAVSHDGLHFREPIPDFPIVSAAEVGWKLLPEGDAVVHYPALIQAQGFENIGDETMFWYAPWPEGDADGVRLATWPRDRLGHFRAYHGPDRESYVISQPISLDGDAANVYVNADGLGEYSGIEVSVVSERFEPISGYGIGEGAEIKQSGFRQPVRWKNHEAINADKPIRIRVDFTGIRPEDVRLYAVYLEQ